MVRIVGCHKHPSTRLILFTALRCWVYCEVDMVADTAVAVDFSRDRIRQTTNRQGSGGNIARCEARLNQLVVELGHCRLAGRSQGRSLVIKVPLQKIDRDHDGGRDQIPEEPIAIVVRMATDVGSEEVGQHAA